VKSCYIHIPFCDKICTYCDFCKMFSNEKVINKYLDALEEEINNKYLGEELKTIYIGGGTPTCLNLEQLKRLFNILSILKRSDDCSITIEGNFENTDYDKLTLFKEFGINRISFGIESIDKDNLEFLGRELDKDKVKFIIDICKSLGILDINLDLMYALPGEDIDTLNKDLDYIFSLDVSHISTYSLIIEEHTMLSINGTLNISEDLDYEMYEVICKRMKDNNYKHYEISNFCKEGFESKHNIVYWKNEEYYGFGLGASGYIDSVRYNNTRSINNYLKGNYVLDYEELDNNLKMEYEIMLNLRLSSGINKNNFYDKYGVRINDIYNYEELVLNNLLIETEENIFIPEDKWYISNEIIIKFLEGV